MRRKRAIPFVLDFDKQSFREIAESRGISVSVLRRQIEMVTGEELVIQAKRALQPKSAGWNPRAGNRKRVK